MFSFTESRSGRQSSKSTGRSYQQDESIISKVVSILIIYLASNLCKSWVYIVLVFSMVLGVWVSLYIQSFNHVL